VGSYYAYAGRGCIAAGEADRARPRGRGGAGECERARLVHAEPAFTRHVAVSDTYLRIPAADVAYSGGLINHVSQNDLIRPRNTRQALHERRWIVKDGTASRTGCSSGYDASSARTHLDLDRRDRPRHRYAVTDYTLQHPRSVYRS